MVEAVPDDSIEISVKGKWVRVPARKVRGNTIIARGRWIRFALIHDEEWLETEITDVEPCVEELKEQVRQGFTADIFTFTQKVPGSPPRHAYPMEWSSVAAID